ncbi:MAG: amidohydrolase [bacterium]|jgi:5-methylthioadenosine/S-adenosylhomocysteine deaminase
MNDIIISGGAVVTVDEKGQIFDPGEVVIRDGKILSVGPAGSTRAVPGQQQLIMKAENKIILPGFINAHTHAAMTLFRGVGDDLPLREWLQNRIWPLEAKLTAKDIYWGTLLAIVEMLQAGVTAFADMYFMCESVAEAVYESGIRASIAPGLLGISSSAEQELKTAVDFCRKWGGKAGGRITTMLGPHAPYTCPPSYLKQVIAAAKDIGVGIHIHLAETKQEVADLKNEYGLTPVAYLATQDLAGLHILAAHCVHLERKDISQLKNYGIFVAHNPGSNLKLASGIAPLPELLAEHIRIALGSDGAASNNNLDILEEARLTALIHKAATGDATAVPATLALEMATRNGAAALGLDKCCGQIKPGLKADLIIINRNAPHMYPLFDPISSLIYSAKSSDVETVLVDGKIIVDKGEIKTVDAEKIMYMADEHARKLLH